jgi:hypothetical protein
LKSKSFVVRRRAANELEEIQFFFLSNQRNQFYFTVVVLVQAYLLLMRMRTTIDHVFVPFLFRLVI